MEKKKDLKIKDLFKMSEIEGLNIDNIISKKMLKELGKKFGKVSFPFVGILLEDTKNILFLIQKNPESSTEKGVIVAHTPNISEKNLKDIIKIIDKS